MFRELDPILHSQARLVIMSVLIGVKSAEFSFLLEMTQMTKGNLSFQLSKLGDCNYVSLHKTKKGNYPLTVCTITDNGRKAYADYVEAIEHYFNGFKKAKK